MVASAQRDPSDRNTHPLSDIGPSSSLGTVKELAFTCTQRNPSADSCYRDPAKETHAAGVWIQGTTETATVLDGICTVRSSVTS